MRLSTVGMTGDGEGAWVDEGRLEVGTSDGRVAGGGVVEPDGPDGGWSTFLGEESLSSDGHDGTEGAKGVEEGGSLRKRGRMGNGDGKVRGTRRKKKRERL